MDAEEAAERKKWADKYNEAKKKEEAASLSAKQMQGLIKEKPAEKKADDAKDLAGEEDDDCPALEQASAEELEKRKQ